MTLVAPREIVDIVYRCCRVANVDPGSSDDIAQAVAEAELVGTAGLAGFLSHHAAGSLDDVAVALRAIDVGEVQVRATGEPVSIDFDSSVARPLLIRRLRQAQARAVASAPTGPDTYVDGIHLTNEASTRSVNAPRRGYAGGVEVDTEAFEVATQIAREFLVSESVLDAAVPE